MQPKALKITEIGKSFFILGNLKFVLLLYSNSGQYNIIWNANEYTSGLYFIKLIAKDLVDTQKIILVK